MAIPYVADVEHAVYNRDRVSQPPSTWTGILAEKLPYLFPAGSLQSPRSVHPAKGARVVISQYRSAGGTVDPKNAPSRASGTAIAAPAQLLTATCAKQACCRRTSLMYPISMRLGAGTPKVTQRWRTSTARRYLATQDALQARPCATTVESRVAHRRWLGAGDHHARSRAPEGGCPTIAWLMTQHAEHSKPGWFHFAAGDVAAASYYEFLDGYWLRQSRRRPGRTTLQPLPACKKRRPPCFSGPHARRCRSGGAWSIMTGNGESEVLRYVNDAMHELCGTITSVLAAAIHAVDPAVAVKTHIVAAGDDVRVGPRTFDLTDIDRIIVVGGQGRHAHGGRAV